MARNVVTNLIVKDQMSGALRTISMSADETRDSLKKVGPEGAKGLNDVSEAAKEASQSLESSALAAGAFGGAIMSAFVVPIGMGTKAAWDQVSAVEQATLAFRAYETDVSKVNAVLDELIAYAQSDLGRLFQREELFSAAQGLKVMGAETENLARYVEIMGRSVAIGVGNWDELVRVIGRVGSTGRLAGEDFDMLTKMGYQLDASLRNQTISWEDLFRVLDAGIGAVGGQSETIVGQLTMTSSALRSLGQDFLGVDEASRFAEGGLGAFAVGSLSTTRDLLDALSPVARAAGESLAFFGGGAQQAVEIFRALPSGVQTTIVSLIGGFGALTVGASATVLAFNQVSAAGRATRATFVALGNTVRAHPILFIASAVAGVALSAWAKHQNSVDSAREAYAALGDEMRETDEIIKTLRLDGYGDLADQMGEMRLAYRTVADDILAEAESYGPDVLLATLGLGGGEQISNEDANKRVTEFLDSTIGQAALDWAKENEKEYADVILNVLANHPDAVRQVTPLVQEMMTDYFSAFELDTSQKTLIEDQMNDIFDLMRNPDIDAGEISDQFWTAIGDYQSHGNFQQFLDDLNAIEDGAYKVAESTRAMRADTEWLIDLTQLRLDGDGALANDLIRLNDVIGDLNFSETGESWLEFLVSNVRDGNIAVDDISNNIEALNRLRAAGLLTEQQHEHMIIQQIQGTALYTAALDDANATIDLNNTLVGQQINRALEHAEAKSEEAEAYEEYLEVVKENMTALIEVAGYGDPLSRWNLEGNATKLSTLAMNANQAAGSLDSIFRVVVGNTNAIGSQFDQIFSWAEDLINKEGEWSKLDDLVVSGRIEGTIGDFTDGSEYALAQQAFNSIAEDNVRLQESILTIQAKQAPLIAEQASAYENLMYQISEMPAEQQLIALGWMDSTTAMRAMEFQTLAVAAATGQLGANGEEVFSNMIIGAAQADPVLKSLLIDMGLIEEGADGTITVNLSGVEGAKSEIALLTEAIVNLIDYFDDGEINGSFVIDGVDNATPIIQQAQDALADADGSYATMELLLVDWATAGINAAASALNALDGRVASTTIRTIYENRGIGPAMALGGVVQEYASGGVVIRAGEIGPEIAHFANGGTALLPRDGLYSVPAGTYISPNHATNNSYGGVTFEPGSIVVNGGNEQQIVQVFTDRIIPQMTRALENRRVGMGAS